MDGQIGNSDGVGGGGSQRPNFLKERMKLTWNFRRGGEFKVKNHPWGRYGYFLEPHNIHWCLNIHIVFCVL